MRRRRALLLAGCHCSHRAGRPGECVLARTMRRGRACPPGGAARRGLTPVPARTDTRWVIRLLTAAGALMLLAGCGGSDKTGDTSPQGGPVGAPAKVTTSSTTTTPGGSKASSPQGGSGGAGGPGGSGTTSPQGGPAGTTPNASGPTSPQGGPVGNPPPPPGDKKNTDPSSPQGGPGGNAPPPPGGKTNTTPADSQGADGGGGTEASPPAP
jgi:hypothetical protein